MRFFLSLTALTLLLSAQAPAQNVVLFTVDSSRADRFGVYGYPKPNTPHIDGWAKTGTVFNQAYSVSAWTAPGLVSILTGLYPRTHGVDNRDKSVSGDLPTLHKILQKEGYRTPNLNFFTFASYYQNLGLPPVDRQYFGSRDGDELLNWLQAHAGRSGSEPFFVWYHTTIVHQPYNPGADDLPVARRELEKSAGIKAVLNGAIVPIGSTQFQVEDKPVLDQLYDAELRRMDRLFKRMLEVLENRGVLDETLIVLTADHGEELLDHGFVGHASTSLQAKLYQEVVRIPLIFSWPGKVPAGRKIDRRASQIDVLPTILSLLGLKQERPVQGVNLFGKPKKERPLFFESVISGNQTIKEHEGIWVRAVIEGDYKFISGEELYNLKADPTETANLADRESVVAERLRQTLERWMKETPQPSQRRLRAPFVYSGPKRACPTVFSPQDDQTLDYDLHTGAVLIDWSGDMETRYLVQYQIGVGDHHISGTFEMQGNHQLLGPLSPELWKNLKAWNPFRIRISPRLASPCWSEWVEFRF